MFTLWIIKLTTRPHYHSSPIISQPWLGSFILSLAAWCEKHNALGKKQGFYIFQSCWTSAISYLETDPDYLIWWLPVPEAKCSVSAATALLHPWRRSCSFPPLSYGSSATVPMLLPHMVCHWHKGCSVSLLFLTALMSHRIWKKDKKNGTVVGADCPSRAQSVCSLRCGMKSQRKPKECELSFCRLPTAAAAHRPFIAWQQGKPPYHNKMEMRRKREQTKAAVFCTFTG